MARRFLGNEPLRPAAAQLLRRAVVEHARELTRRDAKATALAVLAHLSSEEVEEVVAATITEPALQFALLKELIHVALCMQVCAG